MQQLFCRAYQARNVAPTTKTLSSRRTTRSSSSFLTTTSRTTTTRKKRGKRIDVHTRCGLSENAAGILLLSLIDDIAFIGLTASTSKSAMERLNEGGYVGDISTTMTTTTTTVFGMLALLAGCGVAAAIHPGETSSKDEIFIFEKKKKKKKKTAAAAGKKTRR